MAKKKVRKAAAVSRSEVVFRSNGGLMQARESYRLLKVRVNDIFKFIEITNREGKKGTFHKDEIKSILPIS